MPSKRVCSQPTCPTLVDQGTYRGMCDDCRREYNRSRPRQSRGYDAAFDRTRANYKRRIQAGEVILCARCNLPIAKDAPWALDHSDDRTTILGPSHAFCNNRAGGIASHR